MDIEIRPARADDRGPIAELMVSSAPDLYGFLYGDDAVAFVRHEFESGTGIAGWRNVTVAVIDGAVVGSGCFYSRERCLALRPETFANVMGFFGPVGSAPIVERFRALGDFVQPPREGALYLANFGVERARRGHGIGAAMLDHEIARARLAGYAVFSLDVSAANPRAQALYERFGLRVVYEKSFPLAEYGFAAARHMEREL